MNYKLYREKIMGCWLGKAAGGTLGQSYEGCNGPLTLNYYNPVPTDMIPNDDLDLQVLWVCMLKNMEKPVVDRDLFADTWLKHVDFPWDEYALAIRNLRRGIRPPHSGSYDNWFKDGLGAAIRSELWACLAPGDPHLATQYAYEDACVDHVGDGIYAEQFLAALESMAFVECDIDKLIDIGLAFIPAESCLAKAVGDTRKWCSESTDFLVIRQQIIDKWGSESFTNAIMNLSFAVMALLLGKGDFSKTVCLSVNCGRDADCTTATVGAILGIINPDGISARWLKPIGRKLVINDGIVGISPPGTLDEFTDIIIDLKEKISLRPKQNVAQIDLVKYAIQAECSVFTPWFAQDDSKFSPVLGNNFEVISFSGNCGSISTAKIPTDSLYLMRFKFTLIQKEKVRVMFNTPANSRVWLDSEYIFGREGGRMAPSFHRCPINQYKDVELTEGAHELLVGIAPVGDEKNIEWVVGIGNQDTMQWLDNVKFK